MSGTDVNARVQTWHPHWCQRTVGCTAPTNLEHRGPTAEWHVQSDEVRVVVCPVRLDEILDDEQLRGEPRIFLAMECLAITGYADASLSVQEAQMLRRFLGRAIANVKDGIRIGDIPGGPAEEVGQ
jgi:hypothetical protein